MDEQTRGIIQSLLDLTRGNTAQLIRLQAINAIQNQIIIALMSQSNFLNRPPELTEAYRRVRQTALQMIDLADSREEFDILLELTDTKFL